MFVTNDVVWLKIASLFAKEFTGCTKVAVGSAIVKNGKLVSLGANRADLDLCKTARGCLRVELYGDNSKNHRGPADCRAIHSEIDAIASAHSDLNGATIYVTRYPCEACARAIVRAGIKKVIYGREQKISDMTARMFEYHNIEVTHLYEYKGDDVLS